jgi:hypothetical protein
MREGLTLWRVLGVSLVVEAVALAVAIFLAGAGHGIYSPAKLLFPWTMVLTRFTGEITVTGMVLALVQYPAYAVFVWDARHNRWREGRWMILGLVHAAAVVAAFVLADSSFTP